MACFRVRVTQLRRQRASACSTAINTAYQRQGPSCLSGGSRGKTEGIQHPSADEVSQFWEGVIGVDGDFNVYDASWAATQTELGGGFEPIDEGIWGIMTRKLNSWKAPGRDGICGFWWKYFHQAAECLRRAIWAMLRAGGIIDSIPEWLVKGRTVLIPKEGCQGRPEQYWPITCLNTAYKLMTAVTKEVLYEHVLTYSD